MEKDNFNYENNIEFIKETNIEKEIKEQSTTLNSKDHNEAFKFIEESLTLMYEKARALQSLIDYSKMNLANEINNGIADCKTLLKLIEEDRDITKNRSYVKYSVPLMITGGEYLDRDNSKIPKAMISNSNVIMSHSIINSYIPNSLKSEYANINNLLSTSVEKLLEQNSYRSLYMLDTPYGNKVKEVLTFKFNSPVSINNISFELSNCILSKVDLLLEDETTMTLQTNKGFFKTRHVKEVKIELYSNNYIASQKDYREIVKNTNDFWDVIDILNVDENLYVDKSKLYYYLFGIDNIAFNLVSIDNSCSFLSDEVKIDTVSENEYITLEVNDQVQRGSIEYYIIDGTKTTPIIPEGTSEILDEKIFYKAPLRFNYDVTKPIVIKRNGDITNMTLQDALNINDKDAIYTVSYTPIASNISNIINKEVRVKAILRNYDRDYRTFIDKINIKKYGGGKIWIDTL